MRWLLIFVIIHSLSGLHNTAKAQNRLLVKFVPVFGAEVIDLSENSFERGNLHIDALRFYISNVEVLEIGEGEPEALTEKEKHHLVDAAVPGSGRMEFIIPPGFQAGGIRFQLGIDSAIQAAGVQGGDLDPTLGMYWTWQSGYIHFKVEGSSPLSGAANHQFEIHLGGYQAPWSTIHSLFFPLAQAGECIIYFDVEKVLNLLNLATNHHVMSPGEQAAKLSRQVMLGFRGETR